jgi:hypothetical protein
VLTFSFSDSISSVRSHLSSLSEYDLTNACSCALKEQKVAVVDLLCPNAAEDQNNSAINNDVSEQKYT